MVWLSRCTLILSVWLPFQLPFRRREYWEWMGFFFCFRLPCQSDTLRVRIYVFLWIIYIMFKCGYTLCAYLHTYDVISTLLLFCFCSLFFCVGQVLCQIDAGVPTNAIWILAFFFLLSLSSKMYCLFVNWLFIYLSLSSSLCVVILFLSVLCYVIFTVWLLFVFAVQWIYGEIKVYII